MQKRLITLAIASLLAGGASAQSNVTIYGVADAFVARNTAGNAAGNQTQTVVGSGGGSSGRLGFMGEEALGNGLKSIFKLELGTLNIDAATNSIGNTRQAYVGLKSDTVGTLYMGRIQTSAYDWASKYDPYNASPAFSVQSVFHRGSTFMASTSNTNGRQANGVSYISPKLSGLTLRADLAVGEQTTGTAGAAGYKDAQNFYAFNADYDRGPLSIGAYVAQLRNNGGTFNNANEASIKDWGLGGIYDFKVAKAFLNYQDSKSTLASGTATDNKLWNTGVQVPVSATGSVKLAYSQYKNDAANAVKASAWALSYWHDFSKRTTAYVGYQAINNGKYAAFSSGNPSNAVTPSLDRNAASLIVGLRHVF